MARRKRRIRIAVAANQQVFRDGLRLLLTLEPDLEVVAEPGNSCDVLDALRVHQPDILLLDPEMPGLTSLPLLHCNQEEKLKTRIIILGVSEEDDYARAIEYGALGIAHKRTAPELLITGIRRVHKGERWVDPGATANSLQRYTFP